jgi:hypothetical protein
MPKNEISEALNAIERWLQTRPSKGKDRIKSARSFPPSDSNYHFLHTLGFIEVQGKGDENLHIGHRDNVLDVQGVLSLQLVLEDPQSIPTLKAIVEGIFSADLDEF